MTIPSDVIDYLMSEPLVAFLATSADDRPHVAPVWYAVVDETIELTTRGRKLAQLRENSKVSLAVQKAEAGIPEWTVTLLGTATIIEDETTTRRALERINQKYGVPNDAWSENTLIRVDVGSARAKSY